MRGERSTSFGYPFPLNLYASRVAAEVGDAAEKKMMMVMSHEVLLSSRMPNAAALNLMEISSYQQLSRSSYHLMLDLILEGFFLWVVIIQRVDI